jgi:hypothetical protein
MSAETAKLTDLWCGSREHPSPPIGTGKWLLANHYCFVAIVMPILQLAQDARAPEEISHGHEVGVMRSHLLCLRKPPFERYDPSVIVK